MATLTIHESTFQKLQQRAANQKISVDVLAESILQQSVASSMNDRPSDDEIERRIAALAALDRLVEERAIRYPPGFVLDDSRETIYGGPDGRGE
jgi:parvulin-like peptidyl-prolyl isomerase